jgi:hypothetical protein
MSGLVLQSGRQSPAELLQHLQATGQPVVGEAQPHQAQPGAQKPQVAIWIEADQAQIGAEPLARCRLCQPITSRVRGPEPAAGRGFC